MAGTANKNSRNCQRLFITETSVLGDFSMKNHEEYRPWLVCRNGQIITRYHHRADAEMDVQRLNRFIQKVFYVQNQTALLVSK